MGETNMERIVRQAQEKMGKKISKPVSTPDAKKPETPKRGKK